MFKRILFVCLGLLLTAQVQAQNASDYRDQVQTMYVAYYGRPGDEGGIDFWANQLAGANGNLNAIIANFGNSEEFQSRFGELDTETLVNNIFVQLLAREADAGGLAWYVEELNQNRITLPEIAIAVANGAQNDDIATVANKLTAANGFTTAYLQANVSYGEFQIEDAKLYLNAVNSLSESLTAALDGLANLLETFPAGGAVRVRLETTLGDIVLEMYESESPLSVENFLAYVDADFYNDLWFHRIFKLATAGIAGIQGGGFYLDPDNASQLIPRATNAAIVNESSNGLSNVRGSVAMARTVEVDSATSQFYINTVDNTALDYADGESGYAVFAYVVSSMDVVDAIANLSTFSNEVPTTEIKMISVTRVPN